MTRGSRRKRPRRFWRRWRRNQYFPNFPDAEHTNVLLVETSAPLRFPNSYSTSCELQGRRSVRYKTFLLYMYFYITLHCTGYSPSIPLSRHQGPTIPYYSHSLGPISLLRVLSSSYSLLLTASLYDPVSINKLVSGRSAADQEAAFAFLDSAGSTLPAAL